MLPFIFLLAVAIARPTSHSQAEDTRATVNGFGERIPLELQFHPYGRYDFERVQIWENRTLIYDINEATFSTEEQLVISEGIEELSSQTCLLFKERQDEIYFVNITRIDEGCWSHLGRVNESGQVLNLGLNCMYKDIVVHELMHALGFEHEHQRPCRDDYVIINWDNILEEYRFAFEMRLGEEEELVDVDYN